MTKFNKRSFLYSLITLALFNSFMYAQDWTLRLVSKVEKNEKGLGGSTIAIYK